MPQPIFFIMDISLISLVLSGELGPSHYKTKIKLIYKHLTKLFDNTYNSLDKLFEVIFRDIGVFDFENDIKTSDTCLSTITGLTNLSFSKMGEIILLCYILKKYRNNDDRNMEEFCNNNKDYIDRILSSQKTLKLEEDVFIFLNE